MGVFKVIITIVLALLIYFPNNSQSILYQKENIRTIRENRFPGDDWELGLREAVYQTLLKEQYNVKNLRKYIFNAPIIRKQNKALPFGDVTILGRGQLYNSIDGLKFVQDPYQNDCDDCHNNDNDNNHHHHHHHYCSGYNCDNLNYYNKQLLALWTVKRFRHKDIYYGNIYELEYTISPINHHLNNKIYLENNGGFNYNIPGHVFTITSDLRLNYQTNNNPEKHRLIEQNKQYPGAGHPQFLKPLIVNVNDHSDGYKYYLPTYRPTKTKPTIDPKEFLLYKQLLESLKTTQKPQYGPQTFPTQSQTSSTLLTSTKTIQPIYVQHTPKPVTTVTYFAPVEDEIVNKTTTTTIAEVPSSLFDIFEDTDKPLGSTKQMLPTTLNTTPQYSHLPKKPTSETTHRKDTTEPQNLKQTQTKFTVFYPEATVHFTQPEFSSTQAQSGAGKVTSEKTSTSKTIEKSSTFTTKQQTPIYTIKEKPIYTTPIVIDKTSTSTIPKKPFTYTTQQFSPTFEKSSGTLEQTTVTYTTPRHSTIYSSPEQTSTFTTQKGTSKYPSIYTTPQRTSIYIAEEETSPKTTPEPTSTLKIPEVSSHTTSEHVSTNTALEKTYSTPTLTTFYTTPLYFTQTETPIFLTESEITSTYQPNKVIIYKTTELTTETNKEQPHSISDQLPPPEKDTGTTIPYITTVTESNSIKKENPIETTSTLSESTYTVKSTFNPSEPTHDEEYTQKATQTDKLTESINTIASQPMVPHEITTPLPKSTTDRQSKTTSSNFLLEDDTDGIKRNEEKIKDPITEDDIFGKPKLKKTKKTTKKPYVEAPFSNELFGPPPTQKPKIIYSNFYTAATAPVVTNLKNFATTTEIEPKTDQSYVTAISYIVNKKNNTKGDNGQKKYFQEESNETKLKEIKTKPDNNSKDEILQEAELKDKTLKKETFDDLATRLVSTAKSVDYLDKKEKKPKYRRRTVKRKKSRKET